MTWQDEALTSFVIGLITLVYFNEARNIYMKYLSTEKKTENSVGFCIVRFILLLVLVLVGIAFYATDPSNYQETAKGYTGTTVNIDGLALTQFSHHTSSGQKIWDPLDIAEPPAENTDFFITTKRVKTGPQNLGDCVNSNKTCSSDSECAPDVLFDDYDGISTGACVNGTCSVLAWCPPEYDAHHKKAHREVINGSLNFQILIQSHSYIQYSDGYNRRYSNVVQNPINSGTRCKYNETDDYSRKCPYFLLADIVNNVTDYDVATYNELMDKGGVIAILLDWRCKTKDDICAPTYNFTRLDGSRKGTMERGYSFTDSEYPYGNGSRTHVRSTGILFVVLVDASGYRTAWWKVLIMTVTILGLTMSSEPITKLFFCCRICRDSRNQIYE